MLTVSKPEAHGTPSSPEFRAIALRKIYSQMTITSRALDKMSHQRRGLLYKHFCNFRNSQMRLEAANSHFSQYKSMETSELPQQPLFLSAENIHVMS